MYSVKAYEKKWKPLAESSTSVIQEGEVTEELSLEIEEVAGFSMGTHTINLQHVDGSFEVINNVFSRITFTPIEGIPKGYDEEGNTIPPVH